MSTDADTPLRHAIYGETMGTRFSAVFFAPASCDRPRIEAALQQAVDRVDREMSTWKPESDLNRLNAAPTGVWVSVPRALMKVLQTALAIERASCGAFDIGVGAAVGAWGFGASAAGEFPPADQPAGAPHLPPRQALELDVAFLRVKKHAPVSLDLSGIAKGFGVDELGRALAECSISSWLVGIDGEMRARGLKPDGAPWAVGHERPVPGHRELMGVVDLHDRAVATSGNYRHFREVNGKRLSHTIDPRTEKPLANGLASVTVLAPTCMEADAWATAFLVMGVRSAAVVAPLLGLEAIFVAEDGAVTTV